MIDNISANQIGYIPGKPVMPNADAAGRRIQDDTDVTLQVSFADLINQAKDAAVTDEAALEEARGLLLSGQLTSPENVHSAAEDMLLSGI